MAHEWSDYQKAIFNFVDTGKGNAIVTAVAGSGKTTTIVEALKQAYGTTIFLAFNKGIADELKNRGVNARTFHSVTCSAVLRAKPGRMIETDKTRKLVREHLTPMQQDHYGSFVPRLLSLGKQAGIDCLLSDTAETWTQIVEHHDLELDHEDATMAEGIRLTQGLLQRSNSHPTHIDFDDMLYLAVRDGIALSKYQFIFVDEAQDTNAIQRAILRKMSRKYGTRIVAVGDPAQAIYGFRGADSNSMSRIQEEFKCIELPLTVSYRCPQSVVAHARQWVKHIEPTTTAPQGEVVRRDTTWNSSEFAPADLVICRTTRPLITLGYSMLRDRRPFYIMGREIGQSLRRLVERQKAKGIEQLAEKLAKWHTREVEKAAAKDKQEKIQALDDKFETLMFMIEHLPETERTVPELCRVIDTMFAEKKNATVLCTIHKAKGLEAETVWWLNSSQCPMKWAKGWQYQQEENLCYVATTRAKNRLMLIEEKAG